VQSEFCKLLMLYFSSMCKLVKAVWREFDGWVDEWCVAAVELVRQLTLSWQPIWYHHSWSCIVSTRAALLMSALPTGCSSRCSSGTIITWSVSLLNFRVNHRDGIVLLPHDATLAQYMLSPCVCLPVRSQYYTRVDKCWIMETIPYDGPEIVILWCKRSWQNSIGSPPTEVVQWHKG